LGLNWFQKSDPVPVRFLLTGIGASSSNPPDWVPAQQESFVGLAYYQGKARQGKEIVFRFIIEYSSLSDFGTY
jgi:hypothetical protein